MRFSRAISKLGVALPVLLLPPALVALAGTPFQRDPLTKGGDVATDAEIQTRCGTSCHRLPPPDILPRSAWRDSLVRMMLIEQGIPEPATTSGSIPLPPDWARLLRYFEARAPEHLPPPEPWPAVEKARLTFVKRRLSLAGGAASPAIANVRFRDVDGDRRLDLLATEMKTGAVVAGYAKDGFALTTLASLKHPAHIEVVDLDRDGLTDLLVSDLGSFLPGDHKQGAVHLLRGRKEGTFEPVLLAGGLGRVADAQPADFDGDGDLDLVLAVFGWRQTGALTLLENRTRRGGPLAFEPRILDPRTGAIHVPTIDLDADRRPDIITLFAQEHESVVAFLRTGRSLEFTARTLYAAPHPNWGASGIDLVDLDRDGDTDVLMTHGDSFDDNLLKPYHGIQWLENTGGLRFREHRLATLPGAHRAQAADLDGDGDLDIVGVALVANEGTQRESLASVVWLEQVGRHAFERRTLETGEPHHATLDVADYDQDGDPDLAIGWFGFTRTMPAWVDLWENTRR